MTHDEYNDERFSQADDETIGDFMDDVRTFYTDLGLNPGLVEEATSVILSFVDDNMRYWLKTNDDSEGSK